MTTPLIKQPAESRLYTMDFRNLMASTETITSITSVIADVVTSPILAISAQAIVGQKVQWRMAGGLLGTTYEIEVVIVTSAGNTLQGNGQLKLVDL